MFDPWYLLVSLLGGSVGLGAFLYGKQTADLKALLLGIALMGVSYFVTDPLTLAAVSAVLTIVLFSEPLQQWMESRGAPKPRIQSIRKP